MPILFTSNRIFQRQTEKNGEKQNKKFTTLEILELACEK